MFFGEFPNYNSLSVSVGVGVTYMSKNSVYRLKTFLTLFVFYQSVASLLKVLIDVIEMGF